MSDPVALEKHLRAARLELGRTAPLPDGFDVNDHSAVAPSAQLQQQQLSHLRRPLTATDAARPLFLSPARPDPR